MSEVITKFQWNIRQHFAGILHKNKYQHIIKNCHACMLSLIYYIPCGILGEWAVVCMEVYIRVR